MEAHFHHIIKNKKSVNLDYGIKRQNYGIKNLNHNLNFYVIILTCYVIIFYFLLIDLTYYSMSYFYLCHNDLQKKKSLMYRNRLS